MQSFRSGSERRLADAGVELVRGEASFAGPHTLLVRGSDSNAEQRVGADLVFINTGARPATPNLPGLDTIPALDSTSIMELGELPEHLVVLGGGYIGVEFAQMFRRFGSRVTIIHRGAQLLTREDPDVADAIAEILCADGIDNLLRTEPTGVTRQPGGVAITLRTNGAERTLSGTHLLVATGRSPNTGALDLASAGVAVDAHGFGHGERATGNERTGRVRARRREGRPRVHAHLLR